MSNHTFTYQYSAKQNKEIETIRKKYLPREENKLETLKKLDARVQNAGILEGLCIGVIGVLVFGIGMCIGLDAILGNPLLAVLLGILGAGIMLPAYPIYRRISAKTRASLAPEILRLSDEIIKNQN